MTNFKTIQSFKADYCPANFTQYESDKTGLRVVVIDQPGPKVLGYFAVATEIHDDSGAPHTLEHLVFMGSRSYKYKGFLDQLATRAYSDTNAWTDTDQTVYTLSSAGWEGFNQILPVYLEHVVLPTLTDAGCYTEVHHVNGEGADAGVVYSEMQGRENTQGDLMELKMSRLLYPEDLGFRYETGGLTENLRILTADRIRSFHRQMYQPKNLAVVIVGDIDHAQLLSTLDAFEDTLEGQVPRIDEPFDRPWSKKGKAPALRESIIEKIEFPEEDESMGEIMISYFGPDFDNDLECAAGTILLTYLCGSSIALLDRVLVEEEQLASAIYYDVKVRPDMVVCFTLSGVETERLEAVEKRFFEVVEDAASKPLDMPYMQDCLERTLRQVKIQTEDSADSFSSNVIQDHLFGKRDGSGLRTLGNLNEYYAAAKWRESDWKAYFNKYLIDAHHVSLIGVPSKRLAQKLEKDEKERVERQKNNLGEDGLKQLSKKLDEAKAENDREIPKDLLRQFETPGVESIHFIHTDTARSGLARREQPLDNVAQHRVDQDPTDSSLFIHFEHIPTSFVNIGITMCTHGIAEELRPLLLIYLTGFFDSPIMRDGKRIEYEQVVAELERDTVGYSIGFEGSNLELIRLGMQVEPDKYQKAIEWIKTMLLDSIFDPTRLTSKLAQLLADIPEEKRSGSAMAAAVSNMIHTTRISTRRSTNTLVKGPYFKKTLAELTSSPETTLAKFQIIRSLLARPSNFRCAVTADLTSTAMTNPIKPWSKLTSAFPSESTTNLTLQPLDSELAGRSHAALHPGKTAHLLPLRTVDSSYLTLSTNGPTSHTDPRLPALAVAQAYLNAVEGPLWVATRGPGLAYGTYLSRSLSVGRISLVISNSPDAHKAFVAAKRAIRDLADGTVPLDELMLEGAISGIVVGVANEQPTMLAAARVGFANQVILGIEKDWGKWFMGRVRSVGAEEVRGAMREVIGPVLEAETANLVCTCSVGLEGRLVQGFREEGFEVKVGGLGDFGDDYGLGGGVGGGEDDDGEDEDEDEESGDDDDDDDNDGVGEESGSDGEGGGGVEVDMDGAGGNDVVEDEL